MGKATAKTLCACTVARNMDNMKRKLPQENVQPQLMLVLFSARRYRSRVGIEIGIRMSRGNQGT